MFDMRVLVFAALVFVLVGALPGRADDTSALSMGGGRNHHHARRIVRPLAGLCDELANDVTALGVDLSDPYAPALVESFPTKSHSRKGGRRRRRRRHKSHSDSDSYSSYSSDDGW